MFLLSAVGLDFKKFPIPDDNCSICLIDPLSEKACRILTCSHIFHRSCLDEYKAKNQKKAVCPLCRAEIKEIKSYFDCIKSNMIKGTLKGVAVLIYTLALLSLGLTFNFFKYGSFFIPSSIVQGTPLWSISEKALIIALIMIVPAGALVGFIKGNWEFLASRIMKKQPAVIQLGDVI